MDSRNVLLFGKRSIQDAAPFSFLYPQTCPPHGGGHRKFHPGGGRGALIYSRHHLAGVTTGKGPCPCSSSPRDLQTSGQLTHSPAPTQNRGPHGCAGPVPGSQSQVVNQMDPKQTVQLRDEFHTFDLCELACAKRGAAGSSGKSWASRRPPPSGLHGHLCQLQCKTLALTCCAQETQLQGASHGLCESQGHGRGRGTSPSSMLPSLLPDSPHHPPAWEPELLLFWLRSSLNVSDLDTSLPGALPPTRPTQES